MAPPTSFIVVHKFGGAALATAAAISHVGDILAVEPPGRGRIVVTSALSGVTDALVTATRQAAAGDAEAVRAITSELHDRHARTARELLGGDVADERLPALLAQIDAADEELTRRLAELGGTNAVREPLADAILAHGERLAARIMEAMLAARGIPSTVVDGASIVRTDGRHGNAAPDLERTAATVESTLRPLLDRGITIVVPGFIGAGHDGAVVTLGRGGSDLSATVLARAVEAREVTLWKDVGGCMTADPRIVPEARVVAILDAREASELAYFGAKVLHPRTLAPLRAGMTLRLRPFADPTAEGTAIVVGRSARGAPVRAISGISRQALVAVSGTGMLGVPGVAARVFGTLAAMRVSVSLISQASSEQSICFTVPSDRADDVADHLRTAFAEELARGEVEEIVVRTGLTTVAVVGSGMARTPGIAARIFDAVAKAAVNVVAIAQGASERNVSFVVDEREAPAAIRAVHGEFRLGKVGGGRASHRAEPTDIILLGMGRVGCELVGQCSVVAHRGATLRIVGMIDHTGFVFRPRGLTGRPLEAMVLGKRRRVSLADLPGGRLAEARDAVDFMGSHALSRPVLVDVASGDTAPALLSAIDHGMDLVMANKVPLASSLSVARAILDGARRNGRRVLHEATVGAGLPVIDTLQQLHASGDRVDCIDSSPSGTMGYLFSEMGRGRPFSDAVRAAMALGYTEPDPRDDLSGLDVARKGLILARMLGFAGEMKDVVLESLVPGSLRDVSRDDFLSALTDHDGEWARRVAEARARGEVLRYRARATRGGVRVGLVSAPIGSPLASLDGTDNLFVFSTARYRDRPLVVSGPGAGTQVTAAGVLSDILRLSAA